MGMVYTPQLMFPITAVCSDGLLNAPGNLLMATISFCVFLILIGGTGMSVFCAFVFRLSTVADKSHWIHRKAVILITIHVVYTFPTCIFPVLVAHWNPEAVRLDLVQV
jgi:hypothetical protein